MPFHWAAVETGFPIIKTHLIISYLVKGGGYLSVSQRPQCVQP
jgi:hypothetical protein